MPEDIIGYNDILSFFKDTWSPVVVELHSQGGVTLTAFIKNLTAILKPLAVHEVQLLDIKIIIIILNFVAKI